jgi:signal transduction histidine kinase
VELRPSTLVEFTFGELLGQLCDSFTARTQIPVAFTQDDPCLLLEEPQISLYRAVQEILGSIGSRGAVQQVDVFLHCSQKRVEFTLRGDENPLVWETPAQHTHAAGIIIKIERQQGQAEKLVLSWVDMI